MNLSTRNNCAPSGINMCWVLEYITPKGSIKAFGIGKRCLLGIREYLLFYYLKLGYGWGLSSSLISSSSSSIFFPNSLGLYIKGLNPVANG